MDYNDTDYKTFIASLRFFEEKDGLSEIASAYKCSESYAYQVLNGQKIIGRKSQIKFARACGFNSVSEFIKATQKPELPSKKYTIEIDDQETWQHFKVIKRFKNKGIALAMNEKLADFEEYDQWKFIKLLNKIDESIEALKKEDDQEDLKNA